jgi:hypothetical protein
MLAQELVRGIWGATLLLAPQRVLGLIGQPSQRVEQVTRVLGARHLAEVVILARSRRRVPPRWPIVVDLLHATSMLAVAACARRQRRDALASAAIAAGLAGWTEVERRANGD